MKKLKTAIKIVGATAMLMGASYSCDSITGRDDTPGEEIEGTYICNGVKQNEPCPQYYCENGVMQDFPCPGDTRTRAEVIDSTLRAHIKMCASNHGVLHYNEEFHGPLPPHFGRDTSGILAPSRAGVISRHITCLGKKVAELNMDDENGNKLGVSASLVFDQNENNYVQDIKLSTIQVANPIKACKQLGDHFGYTIDYAMAGNELFTQFVTSNRINAPIASDGKYPISIYTTHVHSRRTDQHLGNIIVEHECN